MVFLSTGTGEAPHNYMLWELLRRGHQGPILAACCVRYRRDLGYRDKQDISCAVIPTITYLSFTTREADTVSHKVYIQDLISSGQLEERLGQTLDPAQPMSICAAIPKMIGVPTNDRATGETHYPEPTGVVELLEKRGFRMDQASVKLKGNIHFEEYW